MDSWPTWTGDLTHGAFEPSSQGTPVTTRRQVGFPLFVRSVTWMFCKFPAMQEILKLWGLEEISGSPWVTWWLQISICLFVILQEMELSLCQENWISRWKVDFTMSLSQRNKDCIWMWVMPIQLRASGLGISYRCRWLLPACVRCSRKRSNQQVALDGTCLFCILLESSWSCLKENNMSTFFSVLRACHGAFCWNCLDASFESAAWRFMNWSPNDSWELSQLAANQFSQWAKMAVMPQGCVWCLRTGYSRIAPCNIE